MSNENQSRGRWYDQDPFLSKAFGILQNLPKPYRDAFSQIITILAGEMKTSLLHKHRIKSLGADRVSGMMKAQSKRRPEDRDKALFQALTSLFVLPDSERLRLSNALAVSIFYLAEYLAFCHRMGREDRRVEVKYLIRYSFESGLKGGWQFLQKIRTFDENTETLLRQLAPRFGNLPPLDDSAQALIFEFLETWALKDEKADVPEKVQENKNKGLQLSLDPTLDLSLDL